MPPRLSKRQQRELDELSSAADVVNLAHSSEDEENISISMSRKSGFYALVNDLDEGSSGEHTPAPKSKKAKKKKKKDPGSSTPAKDTSVPPDAAALATSPPHSAPISSPNAPIPSKKEWKALKKAKAKEKKGDKDDIDKALQELSVKYPDLQNVSVFSTGKARAPRSFPQDFHSLLAVSINHLDTQAEMRKFFGAKVVSGDKSTAGPSSGRRQPTNQRSNLTRPKAGWWPAKLREGLTLRALTEQELSEKAAKSTWEDDDERWWTVEYSKRYKGATKAFLQVVLSGDPEGLYAIIRQVPWHADTLLQLAELYSHREEHGQSADFIERAMFTYERAFIGAFTFTGGANRLDFDRVENRPFFLALHRQVIDQQRRGVFRTAFEFARLLYGLDPWSDPHGALLHLEFLAIKAGMHQWLLDVFELFEASETSSIGPSSRPRNVAPVFALPGWAYARALAWRAKGTDGVSQSTQALKAAIMDFPSVVPLLADKAEISLPAEVRSHPAFRVFTRDSSASTSESLLHLLSHLHVHRSFSLWKDPKQAAWFSETVAEVVHEGKLPSAATISSGYVRICDLARLPEFPISIYRHVIVLGSPAQRLLSYIPPYVASRNSLACDPLPPPTQVSVYDEEFFRGAEDAFAGRRSQDANQRMLERLIPEPAFRRQLQDFFEAHPRLLQQFPGGVVQFAQMAGDMSEEALQEIILQVMQDDEAADGGMPGEMLGVDMVALAFPEDVDVGEDGPEPEHGHDNPGAGDEGDEDDEDDEDMEDEEDAPLMPVRVVRNIINRFWGGVGNAQDEDDDSSEGIPGTELDDVD